MTSGTLDRSALRAAGTASGASASGRVAPAGGRVGAAKRVVRAIASLIVFPLVVAYRVCVRLFPTHAEEVFQEFSQYLAAWPGRTGSLIRVAFYRRTISHCSSTCSIGYGTTLATPDVEIGESVLIGLFCNLGHVSIGDDVLIGGHVSILSGKNQHHTDRLDIPIRLQGGTYSRITIGRDAWIGVGACIADDIGDQAIIASGAVVSKPIPPRKIVVGNPGRIVGERGSTSTPVI